MQKNKLNVYIFDCIAILTYYLAGTLLYKTKRKANCNKGEYIMNHFFQTAYKELPETVYALLVLIVIDYVTGVCLAVKEKTASSKVGAKGIASKVLIVCLVALSYIVDTWILHSGEKFSSITIFFYCANEIISIFENVNRFGLPLPRKLRDFLENLKNKNIGVQGVQTR